MDNIGQFYSDIDWIYTHGRILYNDIKVIIECYGNEEPEIILNKLLEYFPEYILKKLFSVWKALHNVYYIYNVEEVDNIEKLYIDRYNTFYDLFCPNIDILNLKDLGNFFSKTLEQMVYEFNLYNENVTYN
jgi:hypothetical protein